MTGGRVDFDDIMRRLEANGFDQVRVEFVPDRAGGLALLDATYRAVVIANRDVPALWAEGPAASVDGATVRLKDLSGPDGLTAWLETFTAVLAAGDVAGSVRATPLAVLPPWFTGLTEPRLVAYVAYDGPFVDPETRANGALSAVPDDPDVLRWCERIVAWAARAGGTRYLSSGGFHQVDPTDQLALHLYRALRVGLLAGATVAGAGSGPAARVDLNANGQAVYQAYDPESDVDRIRDALLANSERTRLGFVAVATAWQYGWQSRAGAVPPLESAQLQDNSPVWAERVPDAHGMQLLTGRHMSRVSDLSGWRVTDLGGDRYLVEASDLRDWFRPGGPSDEVLVNARNAFGEVIVRH